MSDCVFFKGHFNRPNLFYDVRQKNANAKLVVQEIYDFIVTNYPKGSGIIFCFSKKVCHKPKTKRKGNLPKKQKENDK